jgi:hypothetical protein
MDVQWCITTLRRIVSDLSSLFGNRVTVDVLDGYHVQLESVYRELVAVEILGGLSNNVGMERVREALRIVQCMIDENNEGEHMGYSAPVEDHGAVERPRLSITRNQLSFLLEKRFTVPQIASMLGVSVRTIRRRMSEYQLSVHEFYASLTDCELDAIVGRIQTQFPTCGNRQMQGHLFAQGIRIQQHRVRESQRRIDPCGSIMRRLSVISRRKYHVNGPGALWHIDGNHKLIR